MNKTDSAGSDGKGYYTFRIKRREAHLTGLVLLLWCLWSQAGELKALFGSLIDSLG